MLTPNALELCNCCELEPAQPTSRAGYCVACETAARTDRPCWHETESEPMAADDLADWSPWVPIGQGAAEAAKTPGVYMARQGSAEEVVYVGMAGERRGKGLRGRLRVYAQGVSIHSGLGQHALDRALADPEFVQFMADEVAKGRVSDARGWGRAAIVRADLYVRWASCATRREALDLERLVISACDASVLWNLR